MIGTLGLFLLALALAMDCFTVSITCGIIQKRLGRQVIAMALLFGGFQGGMTLLGWSLAASFLDYISSVDHWFAFILLAFLGGKMIWEGFHSSDDCHRFNPSRLSTLLTLAVATSIDALAVGFSFTCMGFAVLQSMFLPTVIIGTVSTVMTVAGKFIGVRLGRRFNWPAEQIGGIILILIGLKVLLEHLTA